jgi:hypothetical protein
MNHRTCSYICTIINVVAGGVMLQLNSWHDFYKIIFKIENKIYTDSGSAPPTRNKKNCGCTPGVKRDQFYCTWGLLSGDWRLLCSEMRWVYFRKIVIYVSDEYAASIFRTAGSNLLRELSNVDVNRQRIVSSSNICKSARLETTWHILCACVRVRASQLVVFP